MRQLLIMIYLFGSILLAIYGVYIFAIPLFMLSVVLYIKLYINEN